MMWDESQRLQNIDWVNHLPKFVFSYNTTTHSTHRKTPREVLFGHKLLGIYSTQSSKWNDDNGWSFKLGARLGRMASWREPNIPSLLPWYLPHR